MKLFSPMLPYLLLTTIRWGGDECIGGRSTSTGQLFTESTFTEHLLCTILGAVLWGDGEET